MSDKYEINNFISPCCKAFNYYDGDEIHCSECKKVISVLKENESLTVSMKYNMNPNLNSISEDIITEFNKNAARYANDESCEKIIKKCEKCKNDLCRYMRNPRGDIIYICTKCRNVFTD